MVHSFLLLNNIGIDRMWHSPGFGCFAIDPDIEWCIITALVHNNHDNTAIFIFKGGSEQLADDEGADSLTFDHPMGDGGARGQVVPEIGRIAPGDALLQPRVIGQSVHVRLRRGVEGAGGGLE